MNNKLILATVLAAGFAGGMLTPFIAPPPVFAQDAFAPAEPVNGYCCRVVLRSPNGNTLWTAGGTLLRPLAIGPR